MEWNEACNQHCKNCSIDAQKADASCQ